MRKWSSILLLIALFVGCQSNDTSWPEIPCPPPQMGKAPQVPIFPPPVTLDPEAVNLPGSPMMQDINNRLRILVQSCPLAEINDDLNTMIESGKIFLNFQPGQQQLASFNDVPAELIKATNFPGRIESYPVLVIDPVSLSRIKTAQDIRSFWLVLYHEYQHCLQWEKSDTEEKETFRPKEAGSRESKGSCECLWRFEREAYLKECLKGLEWGMPEAVNGLAAKAQCPKGFDQWLFWMMSQSYLGETMPECVPVWAKMAGHPNPGAFK